MAHRKAGINGCSFGRTPHGRSAPNNSRGPSLAGGWADDGDGRAQLLANRITGPASSGGADGGAAATDMVLNEKPIIASNVCGIMGLRFMLVSFQCK